MDKVEKAIADLTDVSNKQAQNIGLLTDNMSILVQAVRMRPTKRQTFGITGLMNLITLGVVGVMLFFVISNTTDTRRLLEVAVDCINPAGKCNQIGAERNELNRIIISLRGERLRNMTELDLAKERGDTVAVTFRQAKVDEYTRLLADSGQAP